MLNYDELNKIVGGKAQALSYLLNLIGGYLKRVVMIVELRKGVK